MFNLKSIFILLAAFGFLMLCNSCALFKKKCDCPSFGQMEMDQNTREIAQTVDSLTLSQVQNID